MTSASRSQRQPRFHPRATFTGRLDWLCPFDGRTQVSHLRPSISTVKCDPAGKYVDDDGRATRCDSVFALGLRFAPIPGSARHGPGLQRLVAPPDWSAPDGLAEAFPRGDLFRWQAGWPAHVLAGGDLLERGLADDSDRLSPLVGFIERVVARAAVIEQRYSPAVSLGKAFAEQVSELKRSGLVSAGEFGQLPAVGKV